MVIYQADGKKNILVSVVNKSRYRDTHSEDTIGNSTITFETLINFSLFGAVSRKQRTINTICM